MKNLNEGEIPEDDKHLVIHCQTGEVVACDSHEEAAVLVKEHENG